MYIVYVREKYYLSLVCTFEKAIKNLDVQGGLRLRDNIDNQCVGFI